MGWSRDFPEHLEEAVRAILDGDRRRAELVMEGLRADAPRLSPARRPSQRRQLEVYRRDRFHCRYCDRKTVFHPVFQLLGVAFFPGTLPFHPNWRTGLTHPAIPIFASTVDHVHPVSDGGDPDDPRNLVTACSECQYQKGQARSGWELRPIVAGGWAGLSDVYERLWNAEQYAGPLDRGPSHDRWIALLREPSPAVPDAVPGGLRR
ncbi:MAG: HNH endonuclease [Candidatus Dormibacteraeota bacterium]|nr:HNH endonuclease [Candidatus Dormibacteraeota bacterium]